MNAYKRGKRGVVAALFVGAMLIFGLTTGTVCAKAETGTGTVKVSGSVNVRSDAGTDATRICSLGNGAALIVTGSKKDAAGNIWYAVSFMQNSKNYTGYIMSTYVNYKPTTSQSDTSQNTSSGAASQDSAAQTGSSSATEWKATVTAANVNVRKKAVSGKVVGQVTSGATVTIHKEKTGTDGKIWYNISFELNGETKKGWIRSDFVKKAENSTENQSQSTSAEKKGIMAGDYVRVRKKVVSGAVVCQLNRGTEVTIKKEKNGSDGYVWYKISFMYNGKKKSGFVRSDFVKISEETKADTTQTNNTTTDATESQATVIKKGTIQGNYVRVRKSPVSGESICYLMTGDVLIVQGEEDGSDNKIWYKVSFTYDSAEKSGYIRSDFVTVTEETVEDEDEEETQDTEINVLSDADFEAYLTQQGFPESYKNALRSLYALHPGWEFRAVHTGLNWNDVIAAESKVGTNLVAKNAIASWKSTEKTAYNWKTDSWYTFDGGAWVAASKELVAYYMDPRNFLTEAAIFQFESLEYESYHTRAGVRRLLKDSFMSGKFTEPDGTKKGYAASFVKVGKETGVSPYHLAARCYQEQGKGTSGSVSGTMTGYKNIFNYYNIGAYASNGNSPVLQGLKYAAASTTNEETNYSRPWNTRYKSLLGGAQYIAQKYINAGQNTLYTQKFNVVNQKNLYKHQYMTNIQAAEAEAIKMSKAYTSEDKKLAFYIPIYENMPEAACPKPVSNANPNNYLATLEIQNREILPVFSPETETYDLTVPKKVKKVKISATAIAATSTVEGTGKVKLKRGTNEVKVTCTAENGAVRTYTIYIVRE